MSEDIVEFIRSRYAAVHHAAAPVTYDRFLDRMRSRRSGAALGFRSAADGPLFLERYLDQPIEAVLAPYWGAAVERSRIVEIGSLAGNSGLALLDLWVHAAGDLGRHADIGVAVLTAPLRAMFARLGIPIRVLAPADASRIGHAAALWGSYYTNDPQVCAGSLRDGLQQLERFLARRRLRAVVA
jgi:hypothetical protein